MFFKISPGTPGFFVDTNMVLCYSKYEYQLKIIREVFRVRKKGFTLLELVIVIAIIGIFTAISIPSIGSAVENSKYLKDIQNADLMSKALDASYISFISGKDIDMEEVCAAVVSAGFSVRTESEDAVFVYVRETGNIYVTKQLLQGGYDSRYQKYAQVIFKDADGNELYGYVLDPESKLISSGSGNGNGGLQSISLSDRFLYLERRVEKDAESDNLTEKESSYEISAVFEGLSGEETEKIVWRSSNEEIVAVNPLADTTRAELSVVGAGTAVITVSVEGYGCYAQCVVCTDIRPTEVEIEDILTEENGNYTVSVEGDGLVYSLSDGEEPQSFLPVGTKFTLNAKGIYTYKNAETNEEISLMPSTEEVEFGVIDDGIVRIDPETGEAEIIGAGKTRITIKSKYKSSDPGASETEIVKEIGISGYFSLDSVELQVSSAADEEPAELIFAKNSETEEKQNAVLVELELSTEEESPYIPVDLAFAARFGAGVSLKSIGWTCEKNGAAPYDGFTREGESGELSGPITSLAALLKISEPGIYVVTLEVTDMADKTVTASYTVVATNTSVKTEKDDKPQKETVTIEEEKRQYDIIKAVFGTSNQFYIENQIFVEDIEKQDSLPILKIKDAAIKYSDVIVIRETEQLTKEQLNETQINKMTVSLSLQNFDGAAYSLFFQISTYVDATNIIQTGDKILLPLELTLSYAVDADTTFDFVVPLKFIVEMQ